jgi:flagellar hook capping protein FlgD
MENGRRVDSWRWADRMRSPVKVRLVPPAIVLALLVGALAPTPASAAIRVGSIRFRHYDFHLFSPFSGPAEIRLSWRGSDPDATLTFRLWRGSALVHEAPQYTLETPSSPTSKVVGFMWPAQTVSQDTDYRITVHRGSTLLRSKTFTLLPRLVTITGIRPNPFNPLIRDGFRDMTTVRFHLEGSSNPTIVRIYHATTQGTCCGSRVRQKNLEDQAIGNRTYEWNGRSGDGRKVSPGKYFVRITATKQSFPDDVTRVSNVWAVRVQRG